MEIPANLRDFSFLHAWESLKAHRINIGYPVPDEAGFLSYLSSIGPTTATAELWDLIAFEKSKFKLQSRQVAYSFDQQSDATDPRDFFV
jgi:hypothetical protein